MTAAQRLSIQEADIAVEDKLDVSYTNENGRPLRLSFDTP